MVRVSLPGMRRPIQKKVFRKTYIREWRKHRGLTLEQLSSRLDELGDHTLGEGGLSMLERGERAYTQQTLEAIADALSTDAASLLMRNPEDDEAIWSIWDNAAKGERQMIVDIAKTVVRKASR